MNFPLAKPKPKTYGTYGRLEIPELQISVPVYKTENGNAQAICDKKDSAVYLNWGNQFAIVDHCDQANFSPQQASRILVFPRKHIPQKPLAVNDYNRKKMSKVAFQPLFFIKIRFIYVIICRSKNLF